MVSTEGFSSQQGSKLRSIGFIVRRLKYDVFLGGNKTKKKKKETFYLENTTVSGGNSQLSAQKAKGLHETCQRDGKMLI